MLGLGLNLLYLGIRAALNSGYNPAAAFFAAGQPGVLYDNNDYNNPDTWRVNLLRYSEDFSVATAAGWGTAPRGTWEADAELSPDGTITADRFTEDLTTGIHGPGQNLNFVQGLNTVTLIIKAISGDPRIEFALAYAAGISAYRIVDLSNGSVVGSVGAVVSFTVSAEANGYYKLTAVVNCPAPFSAGCRFTTAHSNTVNQVHVGTGSVFAYWRAAHNAGGTELPYQRITDFNSDFLAAFPNNTFFTDSFGTIPAPVNGLVGLQLDKSEGLVLGVERVANGDFDSATGWTLGDASVTISGGALRFASTPNAISAFYTIPASAAGRFYLIQVAIPELSAGIVRLAHGGSIFNISAAGNYTIRLQAANTSTGMVLQAIGTTTAVVSSVSSKELPGYHRYQTTTGFKPVLRGTPAGANLFTAYGAPGAGWVDSGGGVATATASSAAIPTTTAAVIGRVYRVTYTMTRSAGTLTPSFGGVTLTARAAAGTYEQYITATSTAVLTFTGAAYSGAVSAIDARDVSADAVTAPYGLQYDGVDDFMQTASVDFTAYDKVFVCWGVRKLSDASLALLVELTASSASTNGSFSLFAVITPGASGVGFYTRGTVASGGGSADGLFPSMTSKVLTAQFNNSGATAALQTGPRVDGVSIGGTLTTTSTTTPGNYAAAALYFGRRGGASLPASMLDFGGIIAGVAALPDTTAVEKQEGWQAPRTGVTL